MYYNAEEKVPSKHSLKGIGTACLILALKLQTRFLLFYARVPDGFTKIDDVILKDGKLTIIDHSGVILTLPASRNLQP